MLANSPKAIALANAGLIARGQRDYPNAYAYAERALALDANCTRALIVLADCCRIAEDYEAAGCFIARALLSTTDRIMKLDAKEVQARVWFDQSCFEGAAPRLCEQAAALIGTLLAEPDYEPLSSFALRKCLMEIHFRQGQFADAFRIHDQLRYSPDCDPPYPWTNAPIWDGSDPKGKTILVRDTEEMGIGDHIQKLRYVSVLVERGARVIVETKERLLPLVPAFGGLAQAEILTPGTSPGPHDFSVGIGSLPGLCGLRTPEDILWRGPYIKVPAATSEQWRARILQHAPDGLRVGICWAAAGKQRQIPFAAVREHLLGVAGVRWFSLQRGPHAAAAAGAEVVNIEDAEGTLLDTAAIVENLDLVVSTDSMMAHLAGALGKPTWLLLNRAPDMRWLLDREDSPWYPTMRIFRQEAKGAQEVLQKARRHLNLLS